MIKTVEELITTIRGKMGESPTDEDLALLEDITDTFKDVQVVKTSSDETDWKAKYEQNDAEWRKRYSDRFMGKTVDTPPSTPPIPEDRASTIEIADLFTKGE